MSTTASTAAINLRWLLRLRWGAALGQTLVILLVDRYMAVELPLAALFAVIAIEVASNAACALWASRTSHVPEAVLGALMALDVLLLTVLLGLSGGSFNPFNFLYLVHITLAAVILEPRWTWGLLALSLGCFAALFVLGDSGHMDHAAEMSIHLRGMWVAFAVAAGFIVYFIHRIRRALGERDEALRVAREHTVRGDKLASLATLAAGAAHELATPLATIAVVAGEIEGALARGDFEALAADARLIRGEVTRCRTILDQMSTEAGASPGEAPEAVGLAELVREAARAVTRASRIEVRIEADDALLVRVPRRALTQALRGLLDNACDASAPDAAVALTVGERDGRCCVEVRDHGAGMAAEVLARAGEPFFTTKEPGKGMGLGLFLTHALADRLGGRLELESEPGRGTTARLWLPLADATIDRIAPAPALAEG